MKKIKLLSSTVALVVCLLSGCAAGQKPGEQPPRTTANKKILIVYLSRINNTKAVAEFIQENVGGALVPLELEKPYPENYEATVKQVATENETGFLPPLKTKVHGFDDYEIVYLGFPTWGMQLPPPIKSFLTQYDLKGKTVIPFNTNAGFGEGTSFQTVRSLCPNSTVLEGFTTKGGVERDGVLLAIKQERAEAVRTEVKAWLRKIRMIQ